MKMHVRFQVVGSTNLWSELGRTFDNSYKIDFDRAETLFAAPSQNKSEYSDSIDGAGQPFDDQGVSSRRRTEVRCYGKASISTNWSVTHNTRVFNTAII